MKFIAFLKKNNCHEQFVKGLMWDNIDQLFAQNQPESYISAAFLWEETPEGLDFWLELDKKWLKFIKFLK